MENCSLVLNSKSLLQIQKKAFVTQSYARWDIIECRFPTINHTHWIQRAPCNCKATQFHTNKSSSSASVFCVFMKDSRYTFFAFAYANKHMFVYYRRDTKIPQTIFAKDQRIKRVDKQQFNKNKWLPKWNACTKTHTHLSHGDTTLHITTCTPTIILWIQLKFCVRHTENNL